MGVVVMGLATPSSCVNEKDDLPPGGAWRRVVDLSGSKFVIKESG